MHCQRLCDRVIFDISFYISEDISLCPCSGYGENITIFLSLLNHSRKCKGSPFFHLKFNYGGNFFVNIQVKKSNNKTKRLIIMTSKRVDSNKPPSEDSAFRGT